jgi:two-component system, OmpR family, sensor histidine kinase CiaH
MQKKGKKINRIYFIYWIMLAYVISALVWWFIALNKQNKQMSALKINELVHNDILFAQKQQQITTAQKRKTAQYIGEGATFFLLILAGAIFVFRAIRKELRLSIEQKNFMMAITHELKTPIAISKLNLETLQKHKLTPEQEKKLLSNTLAENGRLDDLCNNLLISSQMESNGYNITFEEINISELLNTCAQTFTVRFAHRTIYKSIASNVFVNGDIFLLQMAFNNLIDNALKYSQKDKPIYITLKQQQNVAIIEIVDEGKGIDDAEKNQVFDKFYRTGNEATKKSKGTGLGLYIVKRICTAHDGNITIKNNPLGGSIFTFTLKAEA